MISYFFTEEVLEYVATNIVDKTLLFLFFTCMRQYTFDKTLEKAKLLGQEASASGVAGLHLLATRIDLPMLYGNFCLASVVLQTDTLCKYQYKN